MLQSTNIRRSNQCKPSIFSRFKLLFTVLKGRWVGLFAILLKILLFEVELLKISTVYEFSFGFESETCKLVSLKTSKPYDIYYGQELLNPFRFYDVNIIVDGFNNIILLLFFSTKGNMSFIMKFLAS